LVGAISNGPGHSGELRRIAANVVKVLAKRWRQHDDSDAAHKLVTSHLRLSEICNGVSMGLVDSSARA
jgi:hypothetical protein